MPAVDDAAVATVRDFNRFYTRRIGVLGGGLLGTRHPLPQARVLYELGQAEEIDVTDLRRTLDIDAGFLSRLLGQLERGGLVTRGRSPADARRQRVRLTARGGTAFAELDALSAAANRELLSGLHEPARRRLAAGMVAVRSALDPQPQANVVLRDPVPGDLGWVVERHGALYALEYGWDASFEALCARVVADFAAADGGRAWIAGVGGERAGCVLCVETEDPAVAKLRLLLVEPWARGLGIGGRLVGACIAHAQATGHERLTLWTNDVLHEARRLYERAGFELDREGRHHAFGRDLVEQTWTLRL